MDIIPYQAEHLSKLYDIYRRTTAQVPHCRFIPSVEYVGAALTKALAADAGILVAEESGELYGIATFRPIAPDLEAVPCMEITGLFAPEEATVVLLLEACLARVGDARKVVAFPADHEHCPLPAYNAGWDGLSDRMPWVARVLARRRFVPFCRELNLECAAPHLPPALLPTPAGITLVEAVDSDGYIAVRAMLDGQEAGICLYSVLSRISDHPDAVAWGYIDWLHIAETHRRRGLGRFLMVWTLRRMWEQGCRGCWLTTGSDNFPAQPLYQGLGFEIVDTSSSWVLTLSHP